MSTLASITKKKNITLIAVLVMTLALTIWTALNGDKHDTDIELVDTNKARTQIVKVNPNEAVSLTQDNLTHEKDALYLANRETPKTPILDLFKVHSWVVVPPVKKIVRKALPPPPPIAPEVPFTYVGKMDDTPNGSLVFLMFNNQLLSVAQGKNVTPDWRIDSENVNVVKFTYLPLNLPKVLIKGAQTNHNPLNPAQQNVPQQ